MEITLDTKLDIHVFFINTKNINIKHETSTKQTAEGGKHEPNTALLGGCRRHLSTEIIT
jgi:hypothetical protein